MDGWMDGRMDGRMDGWMDRWKILTLFDDRLISIAVPVKHLVLV